MHNKIGWSQVGTSQGPDWDAVRDFARNSLILHDREVGLEAEIWRLKHEKHELEQELSYVRHSYEDSISWKIGRFVLSPIRLLRRVRHIVLLRSVRSKDRPSG